MQEHLRGDAYVSSVIPSSFGKLRVNCVSLRTKPRGLGSRLIRSRSLRSYLAQLALSLSNGVGMTGIVEEPLRSAWRNTRDPEPTERRTDHDDADDDDRAD